MAIYSILSKMKGHIVSFLHITAATLNIENPPLFLPGICWPHTKITLKIKTTPQHTRQTAHRD